ELDSRAARRASALLLPYGMVAWQCPHDWPAPRCGLLPEQAVQCGVWRTAGAMRKVGASPAEARRPSSLGGAEDSTWMVPRQTDAAPPPPGVAGEGAVSPLEVGSALLSLVIIDLVLSGDNALVIGM